MLHPAQQVKQPEDRLLSVRGRAQPNISKETHTHTHKQTKTVRKSQSSQTFLLEGVELGAHKPRLQINQLLARRFSKGECVLGTMKRGPVQGGGLLIKAGAWWWCSVLRVEWDAYFPPTYLLTYLPSYLRIDLPNYILIHLSTYLPTYLPNYLSVYLPTYLPTSLPTYLPTPPASLPTYVPKNKLLLFLFLLCSTGLFISSKCAIYTVTTCSFKYRIIICSSFYSRTLQDNSKT